MSRTPTHDPEARADQRNEANAIAWERIITDNRELCTELGRLRGRYGFPMSQRDLCAFCDYDNRSRAEDFRRDLQAVLDKYKIPEAYHEAVFSWVEGLPYSKEPKGATGFPSGSAKKRADGSIEWTLTITPETDMDNPLVLEFIRDWQARLRDPVPRPGPHPDNPRRLDWRPVLEWKLRHPDIPDAEIDRRLGYGKDRTRKKLAELRAELPSHPITDQK